MTKGEITYYQQLNEGMKIADGDDRTELTILTFKLKLEGAIM